ncbi:MAG: hypothetical protein GY844_18515 [Bradyrhizobium sp.]|nr:hypothetical protein [Bradyrhizobium sp.]
MQTSIAQAAALTVFGNDILQKQQRDNFWPTATVFNFCKYVRFVSLGGDTRAPTESSFADTPGEWSARLKSDGTVGLRLHCGARNKPGISDRDAVGFVGGGPRWLIETMRHQQSDLWEGSWQVVDKDAPDRKIWGVTYFRIAPNAPRLPLQSRSLEEVRRDLEIALKQIETFAGHRKLEPFVTMFRNGARLLASDNPLDGLYHPDMGPALPLGARQLLGATQAAWVFGGMGSWNDIGFDGADQQEYEQLSDRLFSLLNEAICAAANTSAPATSR